MRLRRAPLSLVAGCLVALGALSAGSAEAQQESAAAAMPIQEPEKDPAYVVDVRQSPKWTQSRSFAATRFWLLDPGEQEVEVWYGLRHNHNGKSGEDAHLWQLEYMIGATPHVQLDVYFNLAHDGDTCGTGTCFHVEGAQIEGRFSLARHYGEIWGNPALYLEWHPVHGGPDRGEARILLGGEVLTPHLHGALNLYWEQNLDVVQKGDTFTADREIGVAAALGYAIVPNRLSLGGEIKTGGDQEGESSYKGVAKLGPTLWLSFMKGHLRVTSTALFGATHRSDAFNPMVIVGVHP